MQADIHPPYHNLKLKVGQDVFETKSTLGGEILVEVDFRQHRAWNKEAGNSFNQSNKIISAFNNKFGNFGFGSKKVVPVAPKE